MRRRTRTLAVASLAGAAFAWAAYSPAFSDTLAVTNGGFESGTDGWSAPIGATLTVDGSASGEGTRAAHLTSTGAGTVSLSNQYWLLPVTPFHTYTVTALLRDNDAKTSGVTVRVAVLADGDALRGEVSAPLAASDGATFRPVTTAEVVASADARYLRITVTAQASGTGARLSVDGVSVAVTGPVATPAPAPPPPPVAEEIDLPPAPTSTPTPTLRAASTPRPATTPRATATPTPPPTSTPTPVPLPGGTLRNRAFDQGVAGWSVSRGRMGVVTALEGQGPSLLLTVDDVATAWVQQAVAVLPGEWFAAGALLAPLDGVEAAWVRIAWYASADASGAQLSTEDSPSATAPASNAFTRSAGYEVVSTGPVRAPREARSARVRILLRAADERGATLVIDDVVFDSAEAPDVLPHAAPVASPNGAAPAATSTPAAAAPVSARPGAAADRLPASLPPALSIVSTAVPGDTGAAGQRRLRISEVMSNPDDAGADGEFEWVEVTNTGSEPASLAGLSLRDRRAGNPLPPYTLDPGTAVVIAAPGARLPEGVPVLRLRRPIGNGLGNAGDRVALVDTDGREIDAVAYGEGAEEGDVVLPAPGPGQSLERRFSAAGVLIESRVSHTPSPGQPAAASRPANTEAPPAKPPLARPAAAWAVLTALAAGALLGAAVVRGAVLARRRGLEA